MKREATTHTHIGRGGAGAGQGLFCPYAAPLKCGLRALLFVDALRFLLFILFFPFWHLSVILQCVSFSLSLSLFRTLLHFFLDICHVALYENSKMLMCQSSGNLFWSRCNASKCERTVALMCVCVWERNREREWVLLWESSICMLYVCVCVCVGKRAITINCIW